MSDCIFCKIVRGEVPANKVFEDDDVIVFHDIHPMAPVHLLVIPKRHIASLAEGEESDAALFGKMLLLGPRLAREHGLEQGFRTMINTGEGGGQIVFHIHFHIFGDPSGAKLPHL